MPRRPQGLIKRRVKTKEGITVVYYWRSKEGGKDRKVALGSDYAVALTRFREFELNPPSEAPARPVESGPLTVEAFSKRWLAEYAATRRTVRGHDQAEQRFRDYLWPTLGAVPLSELKAADVRRLLSILERDGVGLVTRRRTLEDLRCCLRYAVEEAEVLSRSPWRRGLLPALPEAAPNGLSEVELAQVVAVVLEKWKPVILLLASTGLRWGELRALRWDAVRETPYPHLVISRSHAGPTKSRRVREVPLLPEAQAVLAELPREADLVFSGRGSVMLGETASFLRSFVAKHSKVEGFHVHRLRHTFAVSWLERGGTKETLQEVLGHSTIKLTERYGRLRPWAVAAEAARIGASGGTVSGTVKASAS
jgi:integrase